MAAACRLAAPCAPSGMLLFSGFLGPDRRHAYFPRPSLARRYWLTLFSMRASSPPACGGCLTHNARLTLLSIALPSCRGGHATRGLWLGVAYNRLGLPPLSDGFIAVYEPYYLREGTSRSPHRQGANKKVWFSSPLKAIGLSLVWSQLALGLVWPSFGVGFVLVSS